MNKIPFGYDPNTKDFTNSLMVTFMAGWLFGISPQIRDIPMIVIASIIIFTALYLAIFHGSKSEATMILAMIALMYIVAFINMYIFYFGLAFLVAYIALRRILDSGFIDPRKNMDTFTFSVFIGCIFGMISSLSLAFWTGPVVVILFVIVLYPLFCGPNQRVRA